MKSFAVLAVLLAFANADDPPRIWCGNSCSKDVSTKDACQATINSINTDGHNNGNDNSVWKTDGCTVAYYPPLAGGEAKSLSNTVPQKYAQQLLDQCGASGDGGSAVGGTVTYATELQLGCVCVHSTAAADVCDCGGSDKFGDCTTGYEIGT